MIEQIDEGAIEVLVRRFYAKVRRDPVIGPLFNAAVEDWYEHLLKLALFYRAGAARERRRTASIP